LIDPEMERVVQAARQTVATPYEAMEIGAARRSFAQSAEPWNADPPELHAVSDVTIAGPGGPIACRLYEPAADCGDGLCVYFHGGGWTFGSPATHDRAARRLALASGLRLLSVDYRLAPEHPYPAAHEDAAAIVNHLETHGLGRPIPASRLVLAGDSSGANLALGLLLARGRQLRPAVAGAGFIYGCFDAAIQSSSHGRNGDGRFMLASQRMQWYWANFLGNASRMDAIAQPLLASDSDLAALPPLYLTAAGLDPLLDDSLRLAARLAGLDLSVQLDVVPGVVHGFMQMSTHLSAARRAQHRIGAFLAACLAPEAVTER